MTLIENLEALKLIRTGTGCDGIPYDAHNQAIDACISILGEPVSEEEVERVAKAIFDQWEAEMECEYTEEWENYANKDWFRAIARAAIAAIRGLDAPEEQG